MKTLLRRGRVVSPERVQVQDLLWEEGRILALGAPGSLIPEGEAEGVEVLDAQGAYVLPGFLDFHTHVDDRIGPYDLADDDLSASEIAVRNGVTTLLGFATQGPGESLRRCLERAHERAHKGSHADLHWHLTPTTFQEEDWAAMEHLVASGYRTFKFYTTYRSAGLFVDYPRLEEIFGRLAPLGARFLVHAEDDELLAKAMETGADLARPASHALLRPEAAEAVAVERLLALAKERGARLHLVHVSTVEAARRVREAREGGELAGLSCETCPQYLWLDASWLERRDGHRWICSPPLRGGDREAFRQLALEGAFDVYATDHCAFRREHKDAWDGRDLRQVPNGLPGIGALPHLVRRLYEGQGERGLMAMALRLSANPARLAGLDDRKGALEPGRDADLVLLGPDGPFRPLRSSLADTHETWVGFASPMTFQAVFLRGRRVAADGELLPGPAGGQVLRPV